MNARLEGRPTWVLRALLIAGLLAGLGSLVYMVFVAMVPRAGFPLHVDETYFATCASRGVLSHQLVMPGCHDNKGPLIYVVYGLIARAGGVYSVAHAKVAALLTLVLIVICVVALAWRLGGRRTAALALMIFGLGLGAMPEAWSMNTDVFGALLSLVSLLALTSAGLPPLSRNALAGLFIGLAVMTKQTYALLLLSAVLYLPWRSTIDRRGAPPWMQALVLLFMASVPALCFAIVFALHGQLGDFGKSLVLYPSMYGSPSVDGGVAKRLVYRLGDLVSIANKAPLALGLMLPAVLVLRTQACRAHESDAARLLPAFTGYLALAFVQLATAPVLAPRLTIALLAIGAPVVAAALAQALAAAWTIQEPGPQPPRSVRPDLASRFLLLLIGVLMFTGLVSVWSANRLSFDTDTSTLSVESVPEVRGRVGYVYGVWPQFYFFNHMSPASEVLYASALGGALQMNARVPLSQVRRQSDLVAQVLYENEGLLLKDFAATPPDFIVVTASTRPFVPSTTPSGVASLDSYLVRHCQYARSIRPPTSIHAHYESAGLYRCGASVPAN